MNRKETLQWLYYKRKYNKLNSALDKFKNRVTLNKSYYTEINLNKIIL